MDTFNGRMDTPRKTRASTILEGGIEALAQFASDVSHGETTPQYWMSYLSKPLDEQNEACQNIIRRADSILNTAMETAYPIQIVKICQLYGFSVFGRYLHQNMAGFIISQLGPYKNYGTNRVIIVNQMDPLGKRRYTIAKELAHYLLFSEQCTLFVHRDIGQEDEEDSQAALFALNLLMPEDMVYSALSSVRLMDTEKISYIAGAFAVSPAAAEAQLKRLGILI